MEKEIESSKESVYARAPLQNSIRAERAMIWP